MALGNRNITLDVLSRLSNIVENIKITVFYNIVAIFLISYYNFNIATIYVISHTIEILLEYCCNIS